MTNRFQGVLYTGVTSDIIKRIYEHKCSLTPGFTSRYHCKTLVYYRVFEDIEQAIVFEKRLKRWRRVWKTQLIEEQNPHWQDLYSEVCQIWW